MNYKKQSIICAIISGLIFVTIIISVGYSVGTGKFASDTPYGLSVKYIKLIKTNNAKVKYSDIIDLNEDKKITIVSEYKNQNYLGFYDPQLYFYDQKMINAVGVTRYFSESDYINEAKTGVLVTNTDLFLGFSSIPSVSTPLIEECIFNINTLSSLYKKDIKYIINLTSLDSMGDVIYMDSESINELQSVKEKLLDKGYEIEQREELSLVESIILACARNFRALVLFIPAIALYPIFLFSCTMYFINNRRILKIHKLHGGNIKAIFWNCGKEFMCLNIILTLIVSFVAYHYLNKLQFIYFTIDNWVEIYMLHIIMVS